MEADTADHRAKGGRYNWHLLEVVPLKIEREVVANEHDNQQ